LAGRINLKIPNIDEIEISVFGPKCGYGESILIHIGNGKWIIVDSCKNTKKDEPAALTYLNSLNVNLATQVILIVASHWHGDHIAGLSELLDKCTSAQFLCSSALSNKELQTLAVAYKKCPPSSNKNNIEEYSNIINILETRSKKNHYKHLNPPILAFPGREILVSELKEENCSIRTLSPSDGDIVHANMELGSLVAELLQDKKPKQHIIYNKPNDNAIVLDIKIGEHSILLGSDLENIGDPSRGWKAVIGNKPYNKSDVYKVSHHGSITGDNDDIWESFLSNKPIALITSFIKGSTILPKDEDVVRIKKKAHKAHLITAYKKKPKYPKDVALFIDANTNNGIRLDDSIEHIQMRKKISNSPNHLNWNLKTTKSVKLL